MHRFETKGAHLDSMGYHKRYQRQRARNFPEDSVQNEYHKQKAQKRITEQKKDRCTTGTVFCRSIANKKTPP
jgi:hypothetical protein